MLPLWTFGYTNSGIQRVLRQTILIRLKYIIYKSGSKAVENTAANTQPADVFLLSFRPLCVFYYLFFLAKATLTCNPFVVFTVLFQLV